MGADVPGGFDALALLVEVVDQLVVRLMEEGARDLLQAGEDVPGTGSVLAALQARPKLPCMGERSRNCTSPCHNRFK